MKLAGAGRVYGAPVTNIQEATFAAGLGALRAAAKAVGATVRSVRGAVAVGAAVGQAIAFDPIAFDPVVLGGVEDPESGRIAWFVLAAWDEVPG